MKIAICGSLNFTYEIKKVADNLIDLGHVVTIPITSQRILNGETTLEIIKKEKEDGTISNRAIKFDSIREYWKVIQDNDCVLIANFDKNGIKNYIGGNSFLEMGFAHVLNKKIYLLNNLPEISYTDEIRAMQPIELEGDISKIKENF